MNRIAAAIGLTGVVMLSGAFFWHTVKVQAMSVSINVKDLPEHGVRIIAATDPSFNGRAESFFTGQPKAVVDRIMPFSVILENKTPLAIVGSRLIWEIVKDDGKVFTHQIGSANPRALIEGDGYRPTTRGAAIPPHSFRFVTLVGSATEGEQLDLSNSWRSFRGSLSEMEEYNNALARGDKEQAFNRSAIAKTLERAVSVTVSIDGILFQDGTFVGGNKTGLLEQIKAYVDSQYDVVMELSVSQKEGKTADESFHQAQDFLIAHTRSNNDKRFPGYAGKSIPEGWELTSLAAIKPTSDSYERYRVLHAQTLLKMKQALGATQALREALKLLEKPRVELRRK